MIAPTFLGGLLHQEFLRNHIPEPTLTMLNDMTLDVNERTRHLIRYIEGAGNEELKLAFLKWVKGISYLSHLIKAGRFVIAM